MSRLMDGWICGHKDQQVIGQVGLGVSQEDNI